MWNKLYYNWQTLSETDGYHKLEIYHCQYGNHFTRVFQHEVHTELDCFIVKFYPGDRGDDESKVVVVYRGIDEKEATRAFRKFRKEHAKELYDGV